MNYAELKRRCGYALQDAKETKNREMQVTIRGILESLEAGPFKPGEVVDASEYARRVDSTMGATATVRACWIEEETGIWWVVAEDAEHNHATANAQWFRAK